MLSAIAASMSGEPGEPFLGARRGKVDAGAGGGGRLQSGGHARLGGRDLVLRHVVVRAVKGAADVAGLLGRVAWVAAHVVVHVGGGALARHEVRHAADRQVARRVALAAVLGLGGDQRAAPALSVHAS